VHFVYLPHARSEFLVLKKTSTVARVKACYVACSKHVFSHRKWMKMVYAGGSSRHGYILVGALWSFEIF
jgi:hypothetical protein